MKLSGEGKARKRSRRKVSSSVSVLGLVFVVILISGLSTVIWHHDLVHDIQHIVEEAEARNIHLGWFRQIDPTLNSSTTLTAEIALNNADPESSNIDRQATSSHEDLSENRANHGNSELKTVHLLLHQPHHSIEKVDSPQKPLPLPLQPRLGSSNSISQSKEFNPAEMPLAKLDCPHSELVVYWRNHTAPNPYGASAGPPIELDSWISRYLPPDAYADANRGQNNHNNNKNNGAAATAAGIGPPPRYYVTFEPDRGGWNNIRMMMETVVMFAYTTGRTLVMPPRQGMYLLNKGGRGQNRHDFADFFPFDEVREHTHVISMEEFIAREYGKGGNNGDGTAGILWGPDGTTVPPPLPPSMVPHGHKGTDELASHFTIGHDISWENQEVKQWREHLRRIGHNENFNPGQNFMTFVDPPLRNGGGVGGGDRDEERFAVKRQRRRRRLDVPPYAHAKHKQHHGGSHATTTKGGTATTATATSSSNKALAADLLATLTPDEVLHMKYFGGNGRRKPLYYAGGIQRAPLVHFQSGEGIRLLTHYYYFLFWANRLTRQHMHRFVRDHMHYRESIFCAAARVVYLLRAEARKLLDKQHHQSQTPMSGGVGRRQLAEGHEDHAPSTLHHLHQKHSHHQGHKGHPHHKGHDHGHGHGHGGKGGVPYSDSRGGAPFYTYHIRRGDFQFKQTRVGGDVIVNGTQDLFPADPSTTLVYIATDEKDRKFFEPFMKRYQVRFLSDYLSTSEVKNLNPNYYGMLDQVIASQGELFVGCWFSTFTGYINRMRGYIRGRRDIASYYYPMNKHTMDTVKVWPTGAAWVREFHYGWVNTGDLVEYGGMDKESQEKDLEAQRLVKRRR